MSPPGNFPWFITRLHASLKENAGKRPGTASASLGALLAAACDLAPEPFCHTATTNSTAAASPTMKATENSTMTKVARTTVENAPRRKNPRHAQT